MTTTSGFSDSQSLFCRTAADLSLDSVQFPDTTERFSRYCRWMADMYIVDLASGMCHTSRFGYLTAFVKSILTRICIGLQDTSVVRQMLLWVDAFAVGRV